MMKKIFSTPSSAIFLSLLCTLACFFVPLSAVSAPATDASADPANFKIDPNVPLGVVEGSGADPKAAGIEECGLSTKVKQAWTFDRVKTAGTNLVFPHTTNEIFWFAQFGIKGSMQNNISRSYRIKWISPDGELYAGEDFKSSLWNETFVKKSLRLEVPMKDELIGRWRVRVWKNRTLIDDRYFEIIRTD